VGKLGDASAVSSVIAGLDDATPAVRAAALGALGRLATPEAFAALVARLGRSDLELEPALAALQRAGTRALPALRSCVESQNALGAADGCARALGRVGEESDVERVRAALERGAITPPVALAAFGELGGPNALPPALERLSDPDPAVRVAAATALIELLEPAKPDGRAVDPLLRALRARGVPVLERALLVRLLGRTGAVRAGEPLARVARESTELLLVLAAYTALGDLGQPGYETLLLEGLEHEDGAVRSAAALSLRRVGSGSAARALVERIARPEQDREAIGIALPGVVMRSKDPRLAADLARVLRETRGSFRDALIEALAAAGAAGLAELRAIARSRDPADRAKVAEVLAGSAAGRDIVAVLAKDPAARVRATAVWVTGSIGSREDLPALLAHLADQDAAVAANAAAALGRLGRGGALPQRELCAALGDARPGVRANALAALRLGLRAAAVEPCGAGVVARMLRRDPVPSVRSAAARLLFALPEAAREPLSRCSDQDESSAVAEACSVPPPELTESFEPLLAYVVPTGETEPVPHAPFALALADGTLRQGTADRRGAVFEARAPKGLVRLELVPVRDAPRGM
jgi:HEAT repeat protein